MIRQLSISYESVQQNSYLVIAYGNEKNIVHYQLEMITANEISHFLKPKKQIKNGEIIVYYQISSKIPLGQMLERSKIQREQLLRIIEGAVQAMRDASEYQLDLKGLVMDTDYIYVNPSTFEPYFVYLPLVSADETDIRSFLQNLVMQGKIAMTNDNFIQVLLDMLNSPSFSLEEMEKFIKRFRGAGQERPGSRRPQTPEGFSQKNPRDTSMMWQQQGGYSNDQGHDGEPTILVNPEGQQPGYPDIPPVLPQPPQPSIYEQPPVPPALPKNEGKGKKKGKAVKKGKGTPEQGDFDREKAKKIFLLPQALVMVGLAALISFGAFTDAAGHIVLNNILAAVIIIAVAEVVLYREAYVNGKKKTVKGNGKEKKQGQPNNPLAGSNSPKGNTPMPGQPMPPKVDWPVSGQPMPPKDDQLLSGCPVPPGINGSVSGQMVQPGFNGADAGQVTQRFTGGNVTVKIPYPEEINSFTPGNGAPAPMQVNPVQMQEMPDTENTETEIWDDNQAGGEIYLEYYENGMLTRIILNKPSFLIGRLKGQVDFVVSNTKVGKIHAEFLNQNGVIYVKDFNSKNGTYINGNGERIQSNIPYPLKDQDRVALANSEFTLRCPVK